MAITIGDKAPDFTLVNSDNQTTTLGAYQGKNVLILFFPFAFTGVCTTELCSVRDNLNLYNKADAVVLGISVDSPFTLNKFKAEQKLNFPLLSDFNKTTINTYGVAYEEFVFGLKGVAKRSAFVLDKDGIVQYAEVLESAGDLPDFEAINKTISGL